MSGKRRPSLFTGAVSAVALVIVAVLVVRASLGQLSRPDELVWVNPAWARAGLGFIGLLVAIGAWGVAAVARGRSLDERPGSRAVIAFAVCVVLLAGGALACGDALTDAYASVRGFARCQPSDRFQAGNVRRNDVTLHAYVRVDAAETTLRTHCSDVSAREATAR